MDSRILGGRSHIEQVGWLASFKESLKFEWRDVGLRLHTVEI